ncbi:MAG TPA: acyl-CoA thioesterase [Clostridia bacterium]|nr:acyl-CoA thioesterase [Clostridia bacterium]
MEVTRTVADSYTEQCQIVFSQHKNGSGRLFGGQLIAWMDVVAAVVARRHCGKEVTTVSIDKVDFTEPAFLNDLIIITGKMVYVGNTSMYVKVSAYVEKMGSRRLINSAMFVLVALDENDKPVRVHRLKPVTDEEICEYKTCEEKRKAKKNQNP